MRTHLRKTAQLGELVVAAFDEAARFSTDPREVARLATQAVAHMLSIRAIGRCARSRPSSPAPPALAMWSHAMAATSSWF